MTISPTTRKRISAEAVEWFLQFQRAAEPAPDRNAFSEWLMRSPTHIKEYLAVSSAWEDLQFPDDARYSAQSLIDAARQHHDYDNVVAFSVNDARDVKQERRERERRRARTRWIALAASVVVMCGGWIGYARWFPTADLRTAIGELRSVSLADGSVVVLNTNSEVIVQWNRHERRLQLLKGEARFQVAKHQSRPFVVVTSEATVRAIGTIFNVRAEQSSTEVAVLEGRVKVSELAGSGGPAPVRDATPPANRIPAAPPAASGSVELTAGQRAAVSSHAIELNEGPTTESVSAWTERRLIFRDQPLAEVVSEFNRYRAAPIIIDSRTLAQLRINGVFDLNDPYSLAAYLRDFESVHISWSNDGTVHLTQISPAHQ